MGIALAMLVPDIGSRHFRLMQRRPLVRLVLLSVGVPIMRILVLIKGSVGVPIVESVPTFGRCVGVPNGIRPFDVVSGVLWIVLFRSVCVQFADVTAIVACSSEYISDAFCLRADITERSLGIAIEGYAAAIWIHSREQTASMGAAQRKVALGRGEDYGLSGKCVEMWGDRGITLESYFIGVFGHAPDPQRAVSELVWKYINHVGSRFLSV